jgi:hypothetical protein
MKKSDLDSIKKPCTHKNRKSNNRTLNLLKNRHQRTGHGKYNTWCNEGKSRDFNDNQTSLNPVPNAQVCVCVFDGTYYKIITTTTFPKPLYIPHSACIHRDPGR